MYLELHGCQTLTEGAANALCLTPEPQPLAAPAYFITFILFGTMIVLNLFIGVIMNSMQEAALETARAEQLKAQAHGDKRQSLHDDLAELTRAAEALAERARRRLLALFAGVAFGALEEQGAVPPVFRERGRAFGFGAGLRETAQLGQKIGSNTG
jgi:hypothetical protein